MTATTNMIPDIIATDDLKQRFETSYGMSIPSADSSEQNTWGIGEASNSMLNGLAPVRAAAVAVFLSFSRAAAHGVANTRPIPEVAIRALIPHSIQCSVRLEQLQLADLGWDMDTYLAREAAEWMSEHTHADY